MLGGVPRAMPSLTRAARVGEKVAGVGFDWKDSRGSRSKIDEEMGELDRAIAAGDRTAIEEELGDTLFALVNLPARHTVGVDPESALRRTIDKFTARFNHVEKRVRERHGGWGEPGENKSHLPLEVLDAYWDEAKRGEREREVGGERQSVRGRRWSCGPGGWAVVSRACRRRKLPDRACLPLSADSPRSGPRR